MHACGYTRPYWVVMLLDNFAAHVSCEVLTLLKGAMIHVVRLAPHSSELCQPLNLCINSALKKALAVVWAAASALRKGFFGGTLRAQD